MKPEELIAGIRKGNRRSLARAITLVENEHPHGVAIIEQSHLYPSTSQVIGITGPPGSGKSTLVNAMIGEYVQQDLEVAVLAVDPSSPFTGGAILGDRIPMLSNTSEKIYIRSLASRGRLGGLSPHTFDVLTLMQLAGFDKIIVETVGAGQSEIDIMRNADTVLVLTVPGLGDDMQIIKAGIMEIADIFVVNKADLPQANVLKTRIANMLDLVPDSRDWKPVIVLTSALEQTGVIELLEVISKHYEFLSEEDRLNNRRLEKVKYEIYNKLMQNLIAKSRLHGELLETLSKKILNQEITLGQLLEEMQNALLPSSNENEE